MGELIQFGVTLVQREHGGVLPCVVHPLQQRGRRRFGADHEHGLARGGLLQPLHADPQVRGRVGRRRPADQGGGQPGQVSQPALLVQVRGEVRHTTDDDESSRAGLEFIDIGDLERALLLRLLRDMKTSESQTA